MVDMQYRAKSVAFGQWLLSQAMSDGWIGDLARAAKHDPKFPRQGDPEAVRARLRELGADGDAFQAVDDAETDWLSY